MKTKKQEEKYLVKKNVVINKLMCVFMLLQLISISLICYYSFNKVSTINQNIKIILETGKISLKLVLTHIDGNHVYWLSSCLRLAKFSSHSQFTSKKRLFFSSKFTRSYLLNLPFCFRIFRLSNLYWLSIFWLTCW